ncbi:MAG: hypothetical protein NC218_03365 [Acetobacter sp.]|nr:hypothetical protein [Acetobacter sp.]
MQIHYQNNKITREDGKVLCNLVYNITDKYVGDCEMSARVWADPNADPELILKAVWNQVDTGESAERALESVELLEAVVLEPNLNANMERIIELRGAYAEAETQFECHNNQVSGCWSISGDAFCEKYKLDNGSAGYAQLMDNTDSVEQLYSENIARAEALVGTLTEEQQNKLHDKAEEEVCEEQGAAYWKNLMEQINEEIEKLEKETSNESI